jgi:BirA family transcriptional regulator, biotin operon repressor / biotin---[acetyl-CoA-carboxylase] ligase
VRRTSRPVSAMTSSRAQDGVGFAPLDDAAVGCFLSDAGVAPPAIEILPEVDSTNRYMFTHANPVAGAVCMAEAQPAGRGRAGRRWIATPHSNLMLSITWYFPSATPLSGLSLAAGVAVADAIRTYGVAGVGLKWPNDVLWKGRKLGGLLVETRPGPQRQTLAVIGVGINAYLAPEDAKLIDQPWIDLREITGEVPDRNRLAALVISRLTDACRRYAAEGFASFLRDWEALHVFHRLPVRIVHGSYQEEGVVVGVDDTGSIRVRDSAGRERVFHSGEISLRTTTDIA